MQTAPSESGAGLSSAAELRRLRDVTGNYSQLQGLRLIPVGLVFVANALFWRGSMEPRVFALTFAAALLLYAWIGQYYKRAFGRVRRLMRHHARDGLAVALFVVLVFAGAWAERRYNLPFSSSGLAVAGLFLYLYFSSGSRRRHYLWVAAGFALLSFLPLLGVISSGDFFGRGTILGNLALGVAYILVGIFDHLYLVKSFKPVPAESDADTI